MSLSEDILVLSREIEAHTIEIRRTIHCNPELAFHEFETSALVRSELERLDIPYELSPVEPGVIGLIDSGKPGKLLMLRADMDALPIREDTGLPFASKNEGVMHACGHDVHTSNLLAVADILNRTKERWSGRVKLVFQPGEEHGGGGRQMIEHGLMDELPDACFALHVMPNAPCTICMGTGPMTSWSDGFRIILKGESAHSSTPELGVNAINIAAAVINGLNTILTSNISPMTSSTMNIGVIKGGYAPNVIADSVELNGMMRNQTKEAREIMFRRIDEISKGTASLMGGSAEIHYRIGYASVMNDAELASFAESVFRKNESVLFDGITDDGRACENWLLTGDRFMLAAEDFGFYSQKAPSCFLWVGTGGFVSNHSPKFIVEERYITFCTRLMSLFAVSFLNG